MSEKKMISVMGAYPEEYVWSMVCGSGWETWDWWIGWKYEGGDWDIPCTLRITHLPHDDEFGKPVESTVTVEDLAKAIGELKQTWVVADFVADNLDASSSDCIMQQAVYGEIVYG